MKLRHPVASFIIFATLIGLCVIIYNSFEDNYDVVQTGNETLTNPESGRTFKGNIAEKFASLNLIEGIAEIGEAITGLSVVKITNPLDILGNLASLATGILKVIGGIITFIPEIFFIFTDFFQIPGIVSTAIGLLAIVYIGFIILSAYLRSEV